MNATTLIVALCEITRIAYNHRPSHWKETNRERRLVPEVPGGSRRNCNLTQPTLTHAVVAKEPRIKAIRFNVDPAESDTHLDLSADSPAELQKDFRNCTRNGIVIPQSKCRQRQHTSPNT